MEKYTTEIQTLWSGGGSRGRTSYVGNWYGFSERDRNEKASIKRANLFVRTVVFIF